jgi:hypothetical protein
MRAAAAAALLALAGASARAQSSARIAGGVVSSEEWRVKRAGGEAKQEEFTGSVRYRTGPNVVRCDWALFEHEKQEWRLKGHVIADRTLDSGDRVQSAGDAGFLDMESKSGWLTARDRVTFARTPADGSPADHGSAGRFEWRGRRRAWLEDNVRLWGPRAQAWSDRADYDDATGEVKLSGGRPVLRKHPGWDPEDDWEGAVKADDVRAWQPQKRLVADGQVVGWMLFKDVKGRRR